MGDLPIEGKNLANSSSIDVINESLSGKRVIMQIPAFGQEVAVSTPEAVPTTPPTELLVEKAAARKQRATPHNALLVLDADDLFSLTKPTTCRRNTFERALVPNGQEAQLNRRQATRCGAREC